MLLLWIIHKDLDDAQSIINIIIIIVRYNHGLTHKVQKWRVIAKETAS